MNGHTHHHQSSDSEMQQNITKAVIAALTTAAHTFIWRNKFDEFIWADHQINPKPVQSNNNLIIIVPLCDCQLTRAGKQRIPSVTGIQHTRSVGLELV